jgi:hypothetical protein
MQASQMMIDALVGTVGMKPSPEDQEALKPVGDLLAEMLVSHAVFVSKLAPALEGSLDKIDKGKNSSQLLAAGLSRMAECFEEGLTSIRLLLVLLGEDLEEIDRLIDAGREGGEAA